VRKKAEDALLALGEKAVPALREAKENHPDNHVRYEAERLLDRIGTSAHPGERELSEPKDSPPAPVGPGSGDLEEMLRRLREQGLMSDDYLEQLRKMLEESPGWAVPGVQGVTRGSIQDGEKRIDWERSLDGHIKVTVTRDGETTVYEADSLDELQKSAPEIYEQLAPHLGRLRIRVGPMPDQDGWWRDLEERQRKLWERLFDLPNRPRWPGEPTPFRPERSEPAPGGFRLGVWISKVPEVLREHLGLRTGDGVLIEEVVPGSLADRMGLRRMDILRTLNGERVSSTDDIRKVLGPLEDGAKIEAEIIRRGRPEKLLSAK
jgi:hypothetical protein